MKTGRPPKALEKHIQDGTFRPDRHPKTPVLIGGRSLPIRPDGLNQEAQNIWDCLVADMSASGVLDKADSGVVEAATVALTRAREARRDVESLDSYYVKSRNDALVIHPALRLERESLLLFLRFAEQLGLSPSARARLGLAHVKGMSIAEDLKMKIGTSPRQGGHV